MGHGIIWWIIVGLIAGWAAGKIMKGGGYGVVADIVLGILGAILGGWVVGGAWIGRWRHDLEHPGSNSGRGDFDLAHAADQKGLKRFQCWYIHNGSTAALGHSIAVC